MGNEREREVGQKTMSVIIFFQKGANDTTPAAKINNDCVNVPSWWRYWAQNGESDF
jgi:hypothetical protein